MPWGVNDASKTLTGRTTNNTVQVQDLTDSDGRIIDQRTHGAATEIQEDGFLSGELSAFKNQAIDGQSGVSVVSGHNLTESNQDYVRVSKTTRKIPGAAAAPAAPAQG